MIRPMLASAALVAALVAGCSAGTSGPAAADFAPGTCRTAAPALLGLHATARHVLKSRHADLAAASRAVKRDQQALRSLPRDSAVGDAVQAVVVAAGYFRIRVDGHTYDASLARALDAAYAGAVRVCVTASPGR